MKQGSTLYEPLGGLCTGLKACLRSGIRVNCYLYSDPNPANRRLAASRMAALSAAHPVHLQPEAWADAFLLDPATLSADDLRSAGEQWLVIAYWNQGDSSAQHSALSTLELLRQACGPTEPAYIFGSAAHSQRFTIDQHLGDDSMALEKLGEPVLADAARFGSYAHQIYRCWTSLDDRQQLHELVQAASRPPGGDLQSILTPHHVAPKPAKLLRPPFYPCKTPDLPVIALHPGALGATGSSPTLSTPCPLYNTTTLQHEPPKADECERILGLQQGSTNRCGITEAQRLHLLKNTTDLSTSLACALLTQSSGMQPNGTAAALATERIDAADSPPGDRHSDIWDDASTMHLLRHGTPPKDIDSNEIRRITRRGRRYRMQGDQLLSLTVDGKAKRVPPPPDRIELVKRMHEETGHLGVRRTLALLLTSFWWAGIAQDVSSVVRHCSACDHVNASFNAHTPELNPLPVSGLFYRWGVDLCGPFNKTPRGNTYVMVMIEQSPNKHAEQTAFTFLHHVLGRYGSCAEVCTDQGSEWKGEFAAFLADSLIDHRQTSASHPQANGLAERAVQTCKNALRRIGHSGGGSTDWVKHLAYIMMGYNCSIQQATRISPYALLHATEPTIPPAVRARFEAPLDLDDPTTAAQSIMFRSAALRRNMATAGSNFLIAQHRDTLRYARMRGGALTPRLRRFELGDYVYYRNTTSRTSLDAKAKPQVLRDAEVHPTGVLLLEGKCGGTITAHVSHCAPCHLPIDGHSVDTRLARPSPSHPCEVCGFPDGEEWMLLCDACGKGWHTYCLSPPLTAVPNGTWVCPKCVRKGISPEAVEARALQQPDQAPLPPKHLSALQGAVVMREAAGLKRRSARSVGIAEYSGLKGCSHLFTVSYDDGMAELLSVPQLRARITTVATKPRAKRVLLSSRSSHWDLSSVDLAASALTRLMPGEHGHAKAALLTEAVSTGVLGGGPVVAWELHDLLAALPLGDLGTTFLPWSWGGGDAVQVLRKQGCLVRSGRDRTGIQQGAQLQGFEEAATAGVRMDAICASVSDAVADFLLENARDWARVVVAVRVSPGYLKAADGARLAWLRSMQRKGVLALLDCGNCLWVLVFASMLLKNNFLRDSPKLISVW
ncbi:Retrovirus-related Pol polyprotein from transposon [Tetrabaena socialis]|uniref:Retrovirus-related Pol polyprotein from transposon n=1 Tax=Tetrabaena socialis TaxID=47790 RepID=A0A2J7ZLF0_9CHLO|nr:Retrovirus-related Pol polyprotein from transposon [Tetrabaena socialis]|eukprot:PNH01098.1 Retrovirus-related Pol polyprotein from transposon [Tetrabaena socialis]